MHRLIFRHVLLSVQHGKLFRLRLLPSVLIGIKHGLNLVLGFV